MKNAGMNTARMQSMATNRGSVVSALSKTGIYALDRDRRLVDKDTHGQADSKASGAPGHAKSSV
jgi:hypothetical protein